MKKIGVLFLTLLLALTIVSAQNQNQTEQTIEEKAYSCLKNKLGNNCGIILEKIQPTKKNGF